MITAIGPVAVDVVVQTHWDREWYLPHQAFIARMLHAMERVANQLERGQLDSFLFDGQSAAIEDLFEHCEPELETRIRRLIGEKRIVLGPWYVMADQFLCAGECLMRNLEIGIADSITLGNCQMVGYVPDTFGHVSQLPQILRFYGIDSAVLWRGTDGKASEFCWQSPDGSTVGTVVLPQGYYQHPFNLSNWSEALTDYLGRCRARELHLPLLLTQGGDHLVPLSSLAERIASFNGQQDIYFLKQCTLAGHVASVLAGARYSLPTVVGEQRSNALAFLLPDVLSTRRYLKRLNQEAEDKLLGRVEPLYAQLAPSVNTPERYLMRCWRTLLQQQAHDSICGCSIDEVHAEMETRYKLLDQRLDALIERACVGAGMQGLTQSQSAGAGPFVDDNCFTLFNPRPERVKRWCECSVFLCGEAATALHITGPDGAEVEHVIMHAAPAKVLRSPLDDFPDQLQGTRYQLALHADIHGMSAFACSIARAPAAKACPVPALPVAQNIISNGILSLSLSEGMITLHDSSGDAPLSTALSLLAELDAGDSYNFSPPPVQSTLHQRCFELVAITRHTAVQEMTLRVRMEVPAGLDESRTAGLTPTVVNEGLMRLRLWSGQELVNCQLTWTNMAHDQRTRLLLPLAEDVKETGSDSAFSWETRPVSYARYPSHPSRQEMPVVVSPSNSAVLAGDLIFCHRAMQEFEVVNVHGRAYLGVTLIRSVGWLSRRDLVTRGVGAGPDLATPGAQCIGTETYEFAFGRKKGASRVDALNAAQTLRRAPFLLRGRTGAWRAPVELGNPALQISSLRRVGRELELRIWNPTEQMQPHALATNWVPFGPSHAPMTAARVAPCAIATFRSPV